MSADAGLATGIAPERGGSAALRSSFVVMAGLGVSAVTEVLKDVAVAWRYGASRETDAFYVAVTAPWIFATVLWSAANVALVPLLSRAVEEDPGIAAGLAGRLAVLLAAGISVLCILAAIFAPEAIAVLAPGFHGNAAELAVRMFRVLAFLPVFAALGGVGLAYLNSRKSFLAPALNNAVRNAIILVMLALPLAAGRIWLLPIAVATGVIAQNLLVWPPILATGPRTGRGLGWRDGRVRQGIRQTVLPLAALTVNHSITVVEQVMATFLRTGSVALLAFGSRLPTGLAGLVGAGFSTGSLPYFSRLAAAGERRELCATVASSLRAAAVLSIPGMVLLVALSQPTARLLFLRGSMSAADAHIVGTLIAVFGLTVLTVGLHGILLNVLYAYQEVKTVTWLLVGMRAVSIVLAVTLTKLLGLVGLGVASVVTGYLFAVVLVFMVQRRIGVVVDARLGLLGVRVLVYSGLAGAAAWSVQAWRSSVAQPDFLNELVALALGGAVGVAAFLGAAQLLGGRDLLVQLRAAILPNLRLPSRGLR